MNPQKDLLSRVSDTLQICESSERGSCDLPERESGPSMSLLLEVPAHWRVSVPLSRASPEFALPRCSTRMHKARFMHEGRGFKALPATKGAYWHTSNSLKVEPEMFKQFRFHEKDKGPSICCGQEPAVPGRRKEELLQTSKSAAVCPSDACHVH